MSINVTCPMCRTRCAVAEQNAGKKVQCAKCKGTFTVNVVAPTRPASPVQRPLSRPNPSPQKIAVTCPACRSKCMIAPQNRGKTLRCGSCQGMFKAAGASQAVMPAPTTNKPALRPAAQAPLPVPSLQPAPKVRKRSLLPVIIGTVVCFFVLLAAGAGVAAMFIVPLLFSGPSSPQIVQNKSGKLAADQSEKKVPTAKIPAKQKPPKAKPPAQKPPAQKPPAKQPPKEQPPINGGKIGRATLAKVKDATLYLRVKLAGGKTSEGSGFFGQQPGIILTNAHVLGMLDEWNQKPRSVEAVYRSGLPGEKSFKPEILAVDRVSDLAVLRVNGNGLPEPLQIKSASDLIETQKVYVVGFPLGSNLGKNVTINDSTISALRPDETGRLKQIQVNGGMLPGNSGGPVINTRGEVIGVAVSGIKETSINFAIPGDFVRSALKGSVGNVALAAAKVAGNVRVDADVYLIDPLKQVDQLSIVFWRGMPDGPREPPAAGSQNILKLDPRKKTIGGHVMLPMLTAGQVYWYQPVLVRGANETVRAAARVYRPKYGTEVVAGMPKIPDLKAKPVVLNFRFADLPRILNLSSSQNVKFNLPGERVNATVNMTAIMLERPVAFDADSGEKRIRLEYKKYNLGLPTKLMNRLPPSRRALIGKVVQNVGRLAADLVYDRSGKLVKNDADTRAAPPSVQLALEELHGQMQESLEALEVPIPDRRLEPNETWKDIRKISFSSTEKGVLAALKLTYRYLGIRDSDGREEAVIQIYGDVISRPGIDNVVKFSGTANGLAWFDVAKGQLTDAKVKATTKLEVTVDGRREQLAISLTSTLKRQFVDIAPKSEPLSPGSKYILNVAGDLPKGTLKTFVVKLQAKRSYTVDLRSGYSRYLPTVGLDPYLELRNSSGATLYKNDDIGKSDFNSRIVFRPANAGEYTLAVRSYQNRTGGAYRLTVREEPADLDLNVTSDLQAGQVMKHEVTLTAGVKYTIDVRSKSFDPFLILQDPGGRVLQQDDDGGEGLNSRIVFTAPRTGRFRLGVRSFSRTGRGAYQITVRH